MNIIKKTCKKLLANTISNVSTNVAYTSTKECVTLELLEQPKMPKQLLNKAK